LLANDAERSTKEAVRLHSAAQRPNLFIKIPGTAAGLLAIEESIFRGVPINVTLLFSRDQYVGAAEAYMRGIERRLAVGLDPKVNAVASIFVSRRDKAVADKVPAAMRNRLGVSIARKRTVPTAICCRRRDGRRWLAPAPAPSVYCGRARAPRSAAPDTLYIKTLVAPTPSTRCRTRRCMRLPIMVK
jgi:transaldolase